MKTCQLCQKSFPNWIRIDGELKNLSTRKYCLLCSPRGKHNTRTINNKTEPDGTRHCSKCQQVKPKSEFYFYKSKGKESGPCKQCRTSDVLARQRRVKQEAVDYLGGKCIFCGYSKKLSALEFHHRDPVTKDFAISDQYYVDIVSIKNELDKCDLLCANCHREIHDDMSQVNNLVS